MNTSNPINPLLIESKQTDVKKTTSRRKIIIIISIIFIVITAIVITVVVFRNASGNTAGNTVGKPFGNPINNYRLATVSGCGSGKYVSLTFDDGPAEQNDATLKIINTLNEHGINATFYVSPAAWGDDDWGLTRRCELIHELTSAGNEIQSHSWKHPNFRDNALSNEEIKIELDKTRDFIVDCGGIAPTIFRPPEGALTKQQVEYIVSDLRYIIGLWNLDSNDWRSPNDFDDISANINLDLYYGDSINILMHDRNIYAILDDIINLFDNGYQFITQSQCYERCDTIDSDGVCMDTHGNNLWILNEWR